MRDPPASAASQEECERRARVLYAPHDLMPMRRLQMAPPLFIVMAERCLMCSSMCVCVCEH